MKKKMQKENFTFFNFYTIRSSMISVDSWIPPHHKYVGEYPSKREPCNGYFDQGAARHGGGRWANLDVREAGDGRENELK